MMNKTFKESKEETYLLFKKRCGELLRDFVSEKKKAVCPLCSGSCTETEQTQKALGVLIEEMVIEAARGCGNKADIFLCVLCPYLSTLHFLTSFSRGKAAKLLAKEMEKGHARLMAIIRSVDERKDGGGNPW